LSSITNAPKQRETYQQIKKAARYFGQPIMFISLFLIKRRNTLKIPADAGGGRSGVISFWRFVADLYRRAGIKILRRSLDRL
jgi:hypothetical protein